MDILTQSVDCLQLAEDLGQTFAGMSYGKTLAIGQRYEKALAEHLTSLGLEARQANQRLIPSHRLQTIRKWQDKPDSPLKAKRMSEANKPDPSLYRSHQVDLILKRDNRMVIAEVKALNKGAFTKPIIHIMAEDKLDQKQIPVHVVFLINQATGQVYVAPKRSLWGSDYSLFGKEQRDYTVDRADLVPLGRWIDLFKAGHPMPDLRFKPYYSARKLALAGLTA